jgi:hypothetical protein
MSGIMHNTTRGLLGLMTAGFLLANAADARAQNTPPTPVTTVPVQTISSVPAPVTPAGTAVLPPASAVMPPAAGVTTTNNVIPGAPAVTPPATSVIPPAAALNGTSAAPVNTPPVKNTLPVPASGAATVPATSGSAAGAVTPAMTAQAAATEAAAASAADPMQDEQMHVNIQDAYQLKTRLHKPEVSQEDFHSLFFTPWQYALLQEAKRGFMSRAPSASELQADGTAAPKPTGPHELSLGGIAYRGPKDWTIWLNGQRMTPDALPEQVLDIKVADDHIDLKWFDINSNLIFPVRMRAHQRFNLDQRIFLPGAGTQ